MGKITGFLEFEREERDYEPVADRIKHWREFVLPLPEDENRKQAARCMDCGIPYCHGTVTITGAAMVSGSTFQFSFTSTPGGSFTILSSSNPGQPVGSWTVIGSATEVSPGQYQFSNAPPASTPQQFYRVRSP